MLGCRVVIRFGWLFLFDGKGWSGPCSTRGDEPARPYKSCRFPALELHPLHLSTFFSLSLDGVLISFYSPFLAPLEQPCVFCHSFWSLPFQWRPWLACTSIETLNPMVQDITTSQGITNSSCRTNTEARRFSTDGISSPMLIQPTEM